MNNYIGQKAAAELYENLLCSEDEFLAGLKANAARAGQGLKTDIQLWSVDNDGNHKPFDLYIPRWAITGVVSRTGGGKTTTLVSLAVRLTMDGKTGLYVTLEEPDYAITAKMLASYSAYTNQGYSANKITTGEAMKIIAGKRGYDDMAGFQKNVLGRCRPIDANKHIDGSNLASPNLLYQPQYIADIIDYVKGDGKPLDFVICDFAQLLEVEGSDTNNSHNRVKAVMRVLKALSGTGIAVIIGAQLQRAVFSEWIFDYEAEHCLGGADMEQSTNLLICCGRDTKQKDIDQRDVIRLLKNRNGKKRCGGMTTFDWEHCFIPTLTEQPTEKSL